MTKRPMSLQQVETAALKLLRHTDAHKQDMIAEYEVLGLINEHWARHDDMTKAQADELTAIKLFSCIKGLHDLGFRPMVFSEILGGEYHGVTLYLKNICNGEAVARYREAWAKRKQK